MTRQKIIVILGQTATGKSSLAVKIAQKFGGEVISADSRQVYHGLNLGTGKITKEEMRGVRHHLIDVANPQKQFSVAEYKKLAEEILIDILRRGKLPIVCGGTGLYIDTLINGTILPEVAPNKVLRKKLNKKTARELYSILNKLDSRRAREIDRNNPRRLIRAIEIAWSLGGVPRLKAVKSKYDVLKIGLTLPDNKLKQKIHLRLLTRIKGGMIGETRRLNKQGLSWKRLEEFGLEYRYLAKYLQGKMSRKEMLSELQTEIWHYAKRQKTWFKRDKNIKWFEPKETQEIRREIGDFLKK